MEKLRELSMHKLTRAIQLRFHFAGTNTTPDDTYDKNICAIQLYTSTLDPTTSRIERVPR